MKKTERRPFQGVGQIIRYNAPFYALGLAAIAAGILGLWRLRRLPRVLRLLGGAGVGAAAWWQTASLGASWWLYDHSPLYDGKWITTALNGKIVRRWANLHAGLDEWTLTLRRLFPEAEGGTFDFYDPATMTEPSIRRARRLTPSPVRATPVRADALPLPDATLDAVFLCFAAHEIRDATGRDALFREAARVLAVGGRVVLIEHLRDRANFVAFGPGFFHFWARREWLRVGKQAGLTLTQESRLTAFAGIFVWEKTAP